MDTLADRGRGGWQDFIGFLKMHIIVICEGGAQVLASPCLYLKLHLLSLRWRSDDSKIHNNQNTRPG